MIHPLAASHARHAGHSLRSWRDQAITTHLTPNYSRERAQKTSWAAWTALTVGGCVCAVLADSWWAALAVLLATLADYWRTNHTDSPTWHTPRPWWGPAALGVASLPAAVTVVLGVLSGAATDARLRTSRHTSLRAGVSGATAAVALLAPTNVAALLVGAAWALYLLRCLYRLAGERPRTWVTAPPPDLPLAAAMKWERRVSRHRGGRAEPFYSTLEKVTGRGTRASLDIARKNEGLIAETASGLALADLPRGYRAMYDLALPGAKDANLDAVTVGPTGVCNVDSKAYGSARRPTPVELVQGRFAYQDSQGVLRDLGDVIVQSLWGCKALSERLDGAPVRGIILIHHALVAEGLVAAAQDDPRITVTLTDPEHLDEIVTALPATMEQAWTKEQVDDCLRRAHLTLSTEDGGEPEDLRCVGHGRPLSGVPEQAPVLLYPSTPVSGH